MLKSLKSLDIRG